MQPEIDNILDYLAWAKSQESDPWLRDDLHIAFLTVLWASRGHHQPHVYACQLTLGIHPDEVWPQIIARRHAKLGNLYESFFPTASLPSRKPPTSERQTAVTPTMARRQ